MKRILTLTCFAIAVAAMLLSAGCVPPPHGAAFSPDGKRLAYVDKNRDGVILRDIEKGTSDTILKLGEGEYVLGVYWPPKRNAIYVAMESGGGCGKDKTPSILTLKKIDPDTMKSSDVYQREMPVKCKGDTASGPDIDPAVLLRLFSTNLDVESLAIETGGAVYHADDKAASVFDILPKPTDKESIMNPAMSPDGKYVAWVSVTEFGTTSKDTKAVVNLMSVADRKVTVVYSASSSDKEKQDEPDTLFFFAGLRWSNDSAMLFYLKVDSKITPLWRYEVVAGKSTVVMKDNVLMYTVFPNADKLLVFRQSEGRNQVAVVRPDGTVEDAFDAVMPLGMSGAPVVSPDGSRAVALVSFDDPNNMFPAFLPAMYDLKNHKDEILLARDEDAVNAGSIYFHQARYTQAVPFLKKAGDAGLMMLWLSYERTGAPETAAIYDKLLKQQAGDNGDKDAHYELAKLIDKLNDYEMAEKEYMKSEPRNKANATYRLGMMSERAKQYDRAAESYKKALEMFRATTCYKETPMDCESEGELFVEAPFALPRSLIEAGKGQDAVPMLLAIEKDYPETYAKFQKDIMKTLAEYYAKSGECDKAVNTYKALVDWYGKQDEFTQKQGADDVKGFKEDIARIQKDCGKK
jgi:tetratricopeptide (TPR) repeat protein